MGLRPDLRVEITHAGSASVVSPHGELDIATAPEVDAALEAARGAGTLVLDLRGVEFIDSSGLRIIFRERQRAEVDGYAFVVVRGPNQVQRLLDVAGFPQDADMFVNDPAELAGGGESELPY